MANDLVMYDEKDKELLESLADELRVGGEENLDVGDIGMPPRLRISQPNRPIEVGGKEIDPGIIVNTMTGEHWSDVEIVPIMFLAKTRVMWPESYNADNAPECLSDDGNMPVASNGRKVTDPQPGPCATCPLSQFGGNGEKPHCSMQRNFLIWLVASAEPAILTMQSTALKEARKLTSLAKMQGLKKSIRFTTVKCKDARGSWHVPAFSRGESLPILEILRLVEAKKELANLVIAADTADEMTERGSKEWVVPMSEEDEIPF